TVGFFPWADSGIYARRVSAFSVMVTPSAPWPSVYKVNNVDMAYPWDIARYYALSNCSNTGQDLMSAWYNGTDIVYKISNNNMAFKSTIATTIINGKAGVSIHPNPAKGILNVHGTIGMSFMITDITGRTMISGKLHSANEVIDISSLTPG